jgi:hypothetical protein
MKNNWSLYVAGVGAIDTVSDMLTNFVSKLRDLGLKITDVNVIDGELHPNLANLEAEGENGWTLYAYGEGDVQVAYGEFPTFLQQFKDANMNILASGITVGTPVEIPA